MEPRALICSVIVLVLLHTALSQNKPPSIIKPDKHVTYYYGSDSNVNYTHYCEAEGNPTPEYRWKFNGDDLQSSSTVIVNEKTGTLFLIGFSEAVAGDYQCIAENEISSGVIAVALAPVITLRLAKLGSNWPVKHTVDVPVNVGDYLKLTCDNAPESAPESVKSWYLVAPDDNKGSVSNTDRIYTDNNGSLHFTYVMKSDENDPMLYKCGLFNSFLAFIKLGSEKNLVISSIVGSIPQTGARNQYATNPATFLRTQNAELECVFSGNPIPTITWYDKQGIRISNSKKYQLDNNNRKLTIKDLILADEGQYRCKGNNSAGHDEVNIYLNVTSGPIWKESLNSQTVPENREAVFTCKADPADHETPLAPPVWYKNGVVMDVSAVNTKYEFSDNARVLTVKNLNKSTDIMCFQCNVSNAIGYEFGDGCLNVIEPIVVTVQPSLTQEISQGDLVNLTIKATTDPAYTLSYRWYFKNNTYEGKDAPPLVTFNATTFQAYINTSELSDEKYQTINGTYIREMYHAYDRLNVTVDIILSDITVVGPVAAAAVDLWWIALIVALIILIIVIILIVFICNRKRQEGTYPLDKKERANDIDPEKDLADSGFHDLSRAPGDDDYPTKKSSGINPNFDYGDDLDMGDDDESLMEYGGGDFDTSKFNEDGSFIGQYSSKNKTPDVKHSPVPLNHHATESQI